jgi:hypothetical protein
MGYGFAPFKLKPEGHCAAIAFNMSKMFLLNAERFDCATLLEQEYEGNKAYRNLFGNIMVILFCKAATESQKFLIVNVQLYPDEKKGYARQA